MALRAAATYYDRSIASCIPRSGLELGPQAELLGVGPTSRAIDGWGGSWLCLPDSWRFFAAGFTLGVSSDADRWFLGDTDDLNVQSRAVSAGLPLEGVRHVE